MRKLVKAPENEVERFKRTFADELLEYHFERIIGENEYNGRQWRVLLDEHIEPHVDILCDFSQWLLDRGWSKDVVESNFFIAIKEDKPKKPPRKKDGKTSSIFRLFKP